MPSIEHQPPEMAETSQASPNAAHTEHPATRTLVKSASQVVRDKRIVYVSNLPYQAEVPAIEDVFHKEGIEVEHVEVLKKGHGTFKTGCGLAVVTLKSEADKGVALQKMEGQLVYGRAMAVRPDRFA